MSDEHKPTQESPLRRRRGDRKAASATSPRGTTRPNIQSDQTLSQDKDLGASGQVLAAVPFDFQGKAVRTIMKGGEIWFAATDACSVLDVGNVTDVVNRLDEDEKGVDTIETPGGPQELNTVNEGGLYNLIWSSRKPEAKAFRRWVTGVVLPTLRRTGRFDMGIEADRTNETGTDAARDNPNRITVPLPGPGRYLVVLFHDGERRIEQLSFSDSVAALAALDCRSIAYTHLTAAALWEKLQHLWSLKADRRDGFTFDKLSTTMQAGADLARQILYTYDKPILVPPKAPDLAAD